MAEPTLRHIGEDRLVARLARHLPKDQGVIAGIGDDCAIVGRREDRRWKLLKTDCVIESVHFEPEARPRQIGWKAMARPLSDIAAMGGVPLHALVTLAAHPATPLSRVTGIYAGLRDAAERFGVGIVGGETARSPGPLFLSITLTGEVEAERCIRRSGGCPGDCLYVTGRLGGSIRRRHLTFVPRIEEARWLGGRFRPNAMMDLSDGLGADLPRLAGASGCGFELNEAALPRHRGVSRKQAISDGEDYELLFAINAARARALERAWHKRFPTVPLTHIGQLVFPDASQKDLKGHDHFA